MPERGGHQGRSYREKRKNIHLRFRVHAWQELASCRARLWAPRSISRVSSTKESKISGAIKPQETKLPQQRPGTLRTSQNQRHDRNAGCPSCPDRTCKWSRSDQYWAPRLSPTHNSARSYRRGTTSARYPWHTWLLHGSSVPGLSVFRWKAWRVGALARFHIRPVSVV